MVIRVPNQLTIKKRLHKSRVMMPTVPLVTMKSSKRAYAHFKSGLITS